MPGLRMMVKLISVVVTGMVVMMVALTVTQMYMLC